MAVTTAETAAQQIITPSEYRRFFKHLYWDVAWFGITAGSTASFLSVYAARIGADAFQIGLLNAGPAMVGLLFTLPAGRWLHNRPVGPAVFRTAVFSRMVYFVYMLIPLIPLAAMQAWSLILAVLLASIPATILMIGFNALYAAAVPPEHRGQVAGLRNALLAVMYIVTSLACGFILDRTSLTAGYMIVFGMGFFGAVMSTVHLWFLRDVPTPPSSDTVRSSLHDLGRAGVGVRSPGTGARLNIGIRVFARGKNLLRPEVLRGAYGRLIFALFAFHFAQYLPVALFPIRMVDKLGFTDGQISIGTAVFYAAVLAGSIRFDYLTRRFGNRRLVVSGVAMLSLYPLIIAYMTDVPMYLVVSLIGGAAWALAGGALANFLLEKVPDTDRPAYLAWYNLALQGAILTGSLVGPALAGATGLTAALVAGFVLRLLSAGLIWWAK